MLYYTLLLCVMSELIVFFQVYILVFFKYLNTILLFLCLSIINHFHEVFYMIFIFSFVARISCILIYVVIFQKKKSP